MHSVLTVLILMFIAGVFLAALIYFVIEWIKAVTIKLPYDNDNDNPDNWFL